MPKNNAVGRVERGGERGTASRLSLRPTSRRWARPAAQLHIALARPPPYRSPQHSSSSALGPPHRPSRHRPHLLAHRLDEAAWRRLPVSSCTPRSTSDSAPIALVRSFRSARPSRPPPSPSRALTPLRHAANHKVATLVACNLTDQPGPPISERDRIRATPPPRHPPSSTSFVETARPSPHLLRRRTLFQQLARHDRSATAVGFGARTSPPRPPRPTHSLERLLSSTLHACSSTAPCAGAKVPDCAGLVGAGRARAAPDRQPRRSTLRSFVVGVVRRSAPAVGHPRAECASGFVRYKGEPGSRLVKRERGRGARGGL